MKPHRASRRTRRCSRSRCHDTVHTRVQRCIVSTGVSQLLCLSRIFCRRSRCKRYHSAAPLCCTLLCRRKPHHPRGRRSQCSICLQGGRSRRRRCPRSSRSRRHRACFHRRMRSIAGSAGSCRPTACKLFPSSRTCAAPQNTSRFGTVLGSFPRALCQCSSMEVPASLLYGYSTCKWTAATCNPRQSRARLGTTLGS